ncbi:tripartite motif-containing protein 16-like [Antennarius striatus]|uniref:tripartite motif-containing protein 16-like n=1 Tax=Antennarius striatus TaxID=241820 RepID=UPI0035AE6A42
MAQKVAYLDQDPFSCSICVDLLKDPATIPCGHTYCMSCIKSQWDDEGKKKIYRCPQCRKTFRPRPVLEKNTTLAVLVEKLKTRLQDAPSDQCYSGPKDVTCDVCTVRKSKATKSCVVCLVSYCEIHLQPHLEVASLMKHKLVDPSKILQESRCPHHNEVMKLFCRSDQQCICYLCSVEEHKGHDIVSVAAERTERKTEVKVNRVQIQQRLQDRQRHLKALQQMVEGINRSADKALEDSEKIFTDLMCLVEKVKCDVEQQIKSRQQTEVSRVKELEEELKQEITELKMKDTEVEQLSHTEDHFLHHPSPTVVSDPTNSPSINNYPFRYFEDVMAAVSELRDQLQDILVEGGTNISVTVTNVDVLLPQPEPKTRDEFLKYSRKITLDPNTAHTLLLLSEGNRQVTRMSQDQGFAQHPDRFTDWWQVLSREHLIGRCYWEVEWRGGECGIAVAYKNIGRAGRSDECRFGGNDKSWMLDCVTNKYQFYHNRILTPVSGPCSSRVGVYLDHSAGILSFYSISSTMTLLHRVHTTFTQPLYAGLWLFYYKTTAELC